MFKNYLIYTFGIHADGFLLFTAGLLTLLIAVVTINYQSMKFTFRNLLNSIRDE